MFELRLDASVVLLEARQHLEDRTTVVGEIRGAVVGEHRDLVLRKEPLFDELEQRIEPLRRSLQASAPHHDEEHAMVRRRRRRFSSADERRPVRVGHRHGRQLETRELADHLRHTVFEDSEIVRLQIGDRLPTLVEHPHVERDHRDVRAERSRRLPLPCLCQDLAGDDARANEDGDGESIRRRAGRSVSSAAHCLARLASYIAPYSRYCRTASLG